ncbi:MAG: DUF4157 domain-containing protein [Proteobacteria bacterium]|nr:DUF4157 domain-containing protein [Pseudomonadota bacterium]
MFWTFHAEKILFFQLNFETPKNIRTFFEPRFGYDFSQVRIHTDDRAADAARAVHASAFTVGKNIAFAPNRFAPNTGPSRRHIAMSSPTHCSSHAVPPHPPSPPDQRRSSGGAEVTPGYTLTTELVDFRLLRAVCNRCRGKSGTRLARPLLQHRIPSVVRLGDA